MLIVMCVCGRVHDIKNANIYKKVQICVCACHEKCLWVCTCKQVFAKYAGKIETFQYIYIYIYMYIYIYICIYIYTCVHFTSLHVHVHV